MLAVGNIHHLLQVQFPHLFSVLLNPVKGLGGWSHSQHVLAKSQGPVHHGMYCIHLQDTYASIYTNRQTRHSASSLQSTVSMVCGRKPELPEEITPTCKKGLIMYFLLRGETMRITEPLCQHNQVPVEGVKKEKSNLFKINLLPVQPLLDGFCILRLKIIFARGPFLACEPPLIYNPSVI